MYNRKKLVFGPLLQHPQSNCQKFYRVTYPTPHPSTKFRPNPSTFLTDYVHTSFPIIAISAWSFLPTIILVMANKVSCDLIMQFYTNWQSAYNICDLVKSSSISRTTDKFLLSPPVLDLASPRALLYNTDCILIVWWSQWQCNVLAILHNSK